MTDRDSDVFDRLQDRLGYVFRDIGLLETALTHRSWANEQAESGNYERLEFLGDSVLGVLTAEWLFRRFPDRSEGELSKARSFLVSEAVLAEWGAALGLGSSLKLGVGEERSGGRSKPSLLADALEAVLGAIFVDGGLDAARRVVLPLVQESARSTEDTEARDPKSRLQERLQAAGGGPPRYVHVDEEGPDHAKVFTVHCFVDDRRLGVGSGTTKKIAEQEAAASSLRTLEGEGGPEV